MWPPLPNLHARLPALRCESYYLLARPLLPPPASDPPMPAGMKLVFVDSLTSPYLADLLAFSSRLGITPEFCRAEVQAGDVMALALAEATPSDVGCASAHHPTPPHAVGAAAGWTTLRPHWMDPLLHTFDPGSEGCQFLNAHVMPEYRGRKLQRLLHAPRFRRAWADGKRTVYTIIRTDNGPSLHNCTTAGFAPVVRVDVISVAGLVLCNFRTLTHRLPAGRFVGRGWLGGSALRIGWRRAVEKQPGGTDRNVRPTVLPDAAPNAGGGVLAATSAQLAASLV